jgi:hypothetical protein
MKKLYNTFLLITLFIIIFTISVSAQFVRVISDFVNIRVAPNSDSEIVGKAVKGDIFKYMNDNGEWIEIEIFSDDPRYVHKSLVKVLTGGISAPFSNDICPKLTERLEEAKEGSLTESDVKSQNVLFDRYVLDIFHEFKLQPVIYLIAVNRCIEGPESKTGQRPTVEKEKLNNESKEKTETKEQVENSSPWYEIAQWQGKSIKNTETFHVPSYEWRISWKTEPGKYGDMNFQIYVYEISSSIPQIVANVIGYDMDSSIMRGAGDYYLTINSAQPYRIIVEAKYEQELELKANDFKTESVNKLLNEQIQQNIKNFNRIVELNCGTIQTLIQAELAGSNYKTVKNYVVENSLNGLFGESGILNPATGVPQTKNGIAGKAGCVVVCFNDALEVFSVNGNGFDAGSVFTEPLIARY